VDLVGGLRAGTLLRDAATLVPAPLGVQSHREDQEEQEQRDQPSLQRRGTGMGQGMHGAQGWVRGCTRMGQEMDAMGTGMGQEMHGAQGWVRGCTGHRDGSGEAQGCVRGCTGKGQGMLQPESTDPLFPPPQPEHPFTNIPCTKHRWVHEAAIAGAGHHGQEEPGARRDL